LASQDVDPAPLTDQNCFPKRSLTMTTNNRIVLSSDHTAIALRQAVAAHVGARGQQAARENALPQHGGAGYVASGDGRFG
jgi:ribose 5-phosphate isomerase B